MPQSRYFLMGDLAANALAGLTAALFCHWLIDSDWPTALAMVIAMVAGMVLSMLLAVLVLIRYFGAMEIMLPTMITGMVAGMWVGMRAAMAPLATMDAAAYGILCGLLVIAMCWSANAQLLGRQRDE